MKKVPALLFGVFFFLLGEAISQQNKITLKEIWNGTFQTEGLQAIRSMNNGVEYTVLNTNPNRRSSSIDAYSYLTLEKTRSIFSTANRTDIPYFTDYTFSADESRVLLATMEESIFRRSTRGIYYIYDLKSEQLVQIASEKIREPALSPDGSKVAYVLENNIYLFDLNSGERRQITTDGLQNHIINGVTDWVYEEEFSFVRAFEWNAAGNRIAFLRFDESAVPAYAMDIYGKDLYPYQQLFKYPKAGEANAVVSLHIYDLASARTEHITLDQDYYIPRLQWMNNPDHLSVQTLNRHQNRLRLYKVDAGNASTTLLMEETDAAYLEITDLLTFLPDDQFLWTSEADGYNHVYLHGNDGKPITQLTSGNWEVTKLYGYDPSSKRVFYQSTENGSINRDLYSITIRGKDKLRLSSGEGTHDAAFNTSYTYFIDTFSSAVTPPRYTLHSASNGQMLKPIKNNSAVLKLLENYILGTKEYSTLSVNGYDLNMWMLKPPDFDPTKKYPLLLYQYSGPGSQQVMNSWMDTNDYWHQVLASEGIVVACLDGRGTGFKGREFKKLTYRELGKYEVQDQIKAAQILSELAYIDEARTGIWGWSYGGFMASNCLLKGNDTFETAIAVAPVTSWRFYDTIYTERYMRTPDENPAGYDENSPLSYPQLLEGNFLLVHGSGDDNVHVQNTMRFIEALVQANKQFDWAIYPDRNHSISGGNTRLHLYTLMTSFLKQNL